MTTQKHSNTLELPKVLQRVAAFAGTADGAEAIRTLVPSSEFVWVRDAQADTAAAHALLYRYGGPSIPNVSGCGNALSRAAVGATLGIGELLEVRRLLSAERSLYEYRTRCEEEATPLDRLFFGLYQNRPVEDRLKEAILSETELSDDASDALLSIRRKIKSALASVREQLERMVRGQKYQTYLQDAVITQRDGRFVVPVKVEYKNEIKGLIHDTSQSGQTVFIEPAGVVEENNKIRLLEGQEQQEIARILTELSGMVGEEAQRIMAGYTLLKELDILFAKATYAKETHAVTPILREDGGILLKKARHPLLKKESVVPIDIELGIQFDTLVITGPNTGGKTVALKTLGLLTLMAMCGLMLPAAQGSEISVYKRVLPDIGDEQSIEQSLSTFSSHMVNLVSILEVADRQSLVLVDELGAGTDPVEGAALAVALLERLRQLGARISATTHYAEIKMYALETPGVENACCEFDVETLRPTYRLLIGVPGRSNAFLISQRLGIDAGIIESAKGHVATDSARFEDVVASLEATRQLLEKERQEHEGLLLAAREREKSLKNTQETLDAARERVLESARREGEKLLSTVRIQSEELLLSLEDMRRQKDAEAFGERVQGARAGRSQSIKAIEGKLGGSESDEEYVLPRPLEKGDSVKLKSFGQNGVVLALPDSAGNVMVQTGAMKVKVQVSELRLVQKQPQKAGKMVRKTTGSVSRTLTSGAERRASVEFDMRGMNAEEGIMELERYLDGAVLQNIPAITIIHGKGTGVLRQAVHTFLRKSRQVRTFRLGTFGEGEAGVTIAELK